MRGDDSRLSALLLVAILIASVALPVAMAASSSSVDWSADKAQGAQLYGDVKIAELDRSELADPTDSLEYYDDNGEAASLPGHVNASVDLPVHYSPHKVDDEILTKFPRDGIATDTNDSFFDASEWEANNPNGGIAASVSETTKYGNEGVLLSWENGSTNLEYNNFSITEDPQKRVITIVGKVEDLQGSSGDSITVRFVDSNWDMAEGYIELDATMDSSNYWITNGNNTFVWQVKMSELSQYDGGGDADGELEDIQKVRFIPIGSSSMSANITITGFDVERKSKLAFGDTLNDTDGDGELDTTETIYEDKDGGALKVTSLSTLDSAFNDATIRDVTVDGVVLPASQSDTVVANYADADDYPNFDKQLDQYVQLRAQTAIDLSWSNLELRARQALVNDRYQRLRTAEGYGDTDLENVSSWTDKSGTLTDKGEWLTLDATISPGDRVAFNTKVLYTGAEYEAVSSVSSTPTADGGGGDGAKSGGLSALPIVGGIFAALFALLARFTGGE